MSKAWTLESDSYKRIIEKKHRKRNLESVNNLRQGNTSFQSSAIQMIPIWKLAINYTIKYLLSVSSMNWGNKAFHSF